MIPVLVGVGRSSRNAVGRICEKRVVMVRKGKSEGSLEQRPKMQEEHRDGFFASKAIRDRVFDLKVQSEQARIVFHQ